MFGTNAIQRPRDYPEPVPLNDETDERERIYLVQEVFSTIQGEGPLSGLPAVFVRMWGCNLRCYFCDTDFESNKEPWSLSVLLDRIDAIRGAAKTVVITGGEPLLQQIGPLVHDIIMRFGLAVQIETAGTVWPSSFEDPIIEQCLKQEALTLVCSPKTGNVHPKVEAWCQHWKYIISAAAELSEVDGLPMSSTQQQGAHLALFRPSPSYAPTIWVQPQDEHNVVREYSNKLERGVFISSTRDPGASQESIAMTAAIAMQYGYRVSLQTHKYMGLP